MEKVLDFYEKECLRLEKELQRTKKKLTNLSIFRLLTFLLTSLGIYFLLSTLLIALIIAVFGIIIFIFLLIKYLDRKDEKDLLISKVEINKTEMRVLNGDFSFLPNGLEFSDSNHYFSHDIDVFGPHSFFQYINRTSTKEGAEALAKMITDNDISFIEKKQEAFQELSKKTHWRQHFSALANLVKTKYSSRAIVDFIQPYKPVFSKVISILPFLFSFVSLSVIALFSFQIISSSILVLWLFLGLGVSGLFFKKTQYIYVNTGKAKATFKHYHLLLKEIEECNFSSELLSKKQQIIRSENLKGSTIFMKFSKILDAFDQRNNLLIAFFGNALFLWDLRNAIKAEAWIKNYKHTVKQWFEVIAFFDAENSLANFCFNHPEYVIPIITNDTSVISSTQLGHPLLNAEKRIKNDFSIFKNDFFIVTGANMAGKSTFLRTVSLSIVMANLGLPVCAESFKYKPIKLITSMRTSDSLAENESYFYSELKRLKFIIDTIRSEDYFVLLDEILKGTNSRDKAIGSKKFVEKLLETKSTGIIATHDVSLCELETSFSEIKNHYFDAEIINNELHFDYLFKKGICKNMNASFLLKKMKII